MLSLSHYLSQQFLYNATTNVFNVIALLSAILLLLDPILFVAHTGYIYYQSTQADNTSVEKKKGRPSNKDHLHTKPQWWMWYGASIIIHLLDAWFFRTIIPFFERARSQRDIPTDNVQDLADICRLLWGISRSLSLFVIGLEIWDKRLELKTVLGQNYKNPKWGFALGYFIAPAIIALAASPVALYFVLLGVWNSGGFFVQVIKEAFKPDWRRGQDVFVKTATETVTILPKVTPTKPTWKVWN
jgi:hypothetical protein